MRAMTTYDDNENDGGNNDDAYRPTQTAQHCDMLRGGDAPRDLIPSIPSFPETWLSRHFSEHFPFFKQQ